MSEAISAEPAVENTGAENAEVSAEQSQQSSENQDHAPKADVLSEEELSAEAESDLEEELKELRKKYKAKVNGKEKEIELDLNNDEEVLKYIQKAMASDEKFREAATIRKQMESLVQALKEDPRQVLSHPSLGVDLKTFAENILNEAMEEELKTPEQKAQEALQKELEEKNKKLEEIEQRAREAELARIEEQEFRQLDQEITSALSDIQDLPKSPYVVKRLTDAMIDAVNKGYTEVRVQDVLPIVRDKVKQELKAMFDIMPEEALEEVMGSNNLNRLRKKRLARRKKPVEGASNVKDSGKKEASKSKSAEKGDSKATFTDLFGAF